jgi:drug/metabolite transporter (DMT)-like permease
MPTLVLLLATLFWGASFIFIKIGIQAIHPISFIFFRFGMATIYMLPGLFFIKKDLKRADFFRGTKLGLLVGGIMFLQTIGLQTITASVSAFLTGFAVVFVLIIKFIVQGKTPRVSDIILSLMCIAGLGLITRSHGITWEPGVWYTLGGAFFMALHTYALSEYAGSSNIFVLTLLQMLVLTLLAAAFSFMCGINNQIPNEAATWSAILFCALFCSVAGFSMQAYAQQHLSAFKTSMILTLEPIFTTLFSCLFLGEVLYLQFYIGASLLLGAIILINMRLEQV